MSLFAPAASAALPLGSGDLMGVNANIAHSGGLLGADGLPSRQVSATLFAGARRFHTGGLVSGEVPLIERPGEALFTPGQLRHLGGGVGPKPDRKSVVQGKSVSIELELVGPGDHKQ